MSSSTNPDRPNRLVMALGIATIVLFSINLLAMLSQRVWPKLMDNAFFSSQETSDRVAPSADAHVEVFHRPHDQNAFTFVTTVKKKKRCTDRHDHRDHSHFEEDFERSLELDMNRLESEIEREMDRLNDELSDATSNLEEAISIELNIDGDNHVLLKRLDLSELEDQVEAVARRYEARAQEMEAQVRAKRRVLKERSN